MNQPAKRSERIVAWSRSLRWRIAAAVAGFAAFAASPRWAEATPGALCIEVGDPGGDDRGAILTAITQALAPGGPHAVCLHAGTYNIAPGVGNASFNLGSIAGSPATDLALIGTGSATVLRMNGDGGGATWSLFQINHGAARIAFRDLVLDGSLATNTPAGHLIQIGTADGTQISEVSVDGVTLRGSRNEAIQIGGGATATTHLIAIRSSVFLDNLGAAVDIHGGTENIQISATRFLGNAGEDIRTRGVPVDDLRVTNNLIVRDPAASAAAISLQGGSPVAPNSRATVAGNLVVNGSFDLQHFDDVTLANNVIVGSPQAGTRPEISLLGRAVGTTIDANVVVRTATAVAVVLSAGAVSNAAPTRLVLHANVLVQPTAANIAQLNSVSDLVVAANHLVFASASVATLSGVQVRAIVVQSDRFLFTDNLIAGDAGGGSLAAAIRLSSSTGFPIAHAVITGNVARGAIHGVALDNAFSGPVTVADNLFDTTDEIVGGFAAVMIGGNRGDPVQLVGTGDPTTAGVTAPSGSIYQRRDVAAANQTLYVRQGRTWVAK